MCTHLCHRVRRELAVWPCHGHVAQDGATPDAHAAAHHHAVPQVHSVLNDHSVRRQPVPLRRLLHGVFVRFLLKTSWHTIIMSHVALLPLRQMPETSPAALHADFDAC